ncbi:BadF/BadG/BcrA/BcrD ATPase family protein [Pseudidiomarina atlantica]|uniref:BadF/BadG/BcrA/BcrD ATPase family protein n=1 Tax=Pseudidiomarina atlantica TaxID=1517416 RepID=UPI000690E5E1|nr:BadF/BadG/BcrA/BcrD ATPase family protein [Pseudidiomarina atlantica]
MQATYYAGVDGGGTKCRAELYDASGKLLGAGVAGSANIARHGETAQQSIVNAVTLAVANAGLDAQVLSEVVVCGGFAGANLPSAAAELRAWYHPFAAFHFASDLHTALFGAHAGANGAVLIVGTGSCAAALVDGEVIQFGGHGFLLGDKGSGAWLGKQAVTYTLEALDNVVSAGPLSAAVCEHYQCATPTALVDRLNQAPPGVFGEISPLIIDLAATDEPVALALVQQGCQYLSDIARKALQRSKGQLVLTGGVAGVLGQWLDADVRDAITTAQKGPEWGAIALFCGRESGGSFATGDSK